MVKEIKTGFWRWKHLVANTTSTDRTLHVWWLYKHSFGNSPV